MSLPREFKFKSTGDSVIDALWVAYLHEQGFFTLPMSVPQFVSAYMACKNVYGFGIENNTIGVFLADLNEDDFSEMPVTEVDVDKQAVVAYSNETPDASTALTDRILLDEAVDIIQAWRETPLLPNQISALQHLSSTHHVLQGTPS